MYDPTKPYHCGTNCYCDDLKAGRVPDAITNPILRAILQQEVDRGIALNKAAAEAEVTAEGPAPDRPDLKTAYRQTTGTEVHASVKAGRVKLQFTATEPFPGALEKTQPDGTPITTTETTAVHVMTADEALALANLIALKAMEAKELELAPILRGDDTVDSILGLFEAVLGASRR